MQKDLLTEAIELITFLSNYLQSAEKEGLELPIAMDAVAAFMSRLEHPDINPDVKLTAQLLRGKVLQIAPFQITLDEGYMVYDIGIGPDETATLLIHKNALRALNDLIGQVTGS